MSLVNQLIRFFNRNSSIPFQENLKSGIWLIFLALYLALNACVPVSPPASLPTSSPPPMPLVVTETATPVVEEEVLQPTNTITPTGIIPEELTPTITNTSVIRTPITDFTLTVTPTPVSWVGEGTELPEARIKILSPGHLSRVMSPFYLSLDLVPGYNGLVRIELVGEDGRELLRSIESPLDWRGTPRLDFIREIEFEIEGLVEYARLQVSVDDQFGRTTHLTSVDLFLMSDGVAEIFPSGENTEKIIIQHPAPNLTVYGNYLIISGLAKPADDKPLVIEIMSEEGKYIATGMAPVIIPEGETWGLFAAEIHLDLTETQRVLIVVRERGSRIPGNAAISSVEVLLSP